MLKKLFGPTCHYLVGFGESEKQLMAPLDHAGLCSLAAGAMLEV